MLQQKCERDEKVNKWWRGQSHKPAEWYIWFITEWESTWHCPSNLQAQFVLTNFLIIILSTSQKARPDKQRKGEERKMDADGTPVIRGSPIRGFIPFRCPVVECILLWNNKMWKRKWKPSAAEPSVLSRVSRLSATLELPNPNKLNSH